MSLIHKEVGDFAVEAFLNDEFKTVKRADIAGKFGDHRRVGFVAAQQEVLLAAPQLEDVLKSSLGGVTHLTLDLAKLGYVSSAGLRVILGAQKQMAKLDGMVVKNVNETVMDVFEVTGFKEILSLE